MMLIQNLFQIVVVFKQFFIGSIAQLIMSQAHITETTYLPPSPTPAVSTSQEHQSILIRNNKAFTIIALILQLMFIAFFGGWMRPVAVAANNYVGLYIATGVALLVLIGFGLYFSYLRSMQWSGLGFTFLITVLTFQYYFLVNGFWTKANLQYSTDLFTNQYKMISAFLADQNGATLSTYGNTAVGAFKCALSLTIAFMGILGRAGPLQAQILVIFGVIGHQFNRQLISLFSYDVGGSMHIFLFGGVAGTIIALILGKCKQPSFANHPSYTSSKMNITFAAIGSCFCWVFFPVLNMNLPSTLFTYSFGGIATVYCISATVITSVAFSMLVHGKLRYRDFITAPIAGGVIIGSSSSMIYTPMEAIFIGIIAGALQILFNHLDVLISDLPIFSNNICFTFALQGFLGGLISAIMRAINKTSTNYGSMYNSIAAPYNMYQQGGQISGTFVTIGIAAITGLVIALPLYCVNKEEWGDYYEDATYWHTADDGISKKRITTAQQLPAVSQGQINQGGSVKGQHAYL